MIGSFLKSALALLVVMAAPAGATPLQLTPPSPMEGGQPPADGAPAATDRTQDSGVQTGPDGIGSEPLQKIDSQSVGVLAQEEGSLGADMWHGTPRALAETLLSRLPLKTRSPSMRAVMKRLLLGTAQVPVGEGSSENFALLRLRLLAEMGEHRAMGELLRALPPSADDSLIRLETDFHLMEGNRAAACALAGTQMDKIVEPYWHRLVTFCQALAGNGDMARLALELMIESGDGDGVYAGLLEAVIAHQEGATPGGSAPPFLASGSQEPSPLRLAMIEAAGLSIAAAAGERNGIGLLRALLRDPGAPAELRARAAEKAHAAGALSIGELQQVYRLIRLDQSEIKAPLSSAKQATGPKRRAILLASLQGEEIPSVRAEIIALALDLAEEDETESLTAKLMAPALIDLRPSIDLSWFAPRAVRALLSAGRLQEMRGWFVLLRAAAQSDETAATALIAARPLARLSGQDVAQGDWHPAAQKAWHDAFVGAPSLSGSLTLEEHRRATVLYALLDGLGAPVVAAHWSDLIGGPQESRPAPPFADLAHLRRAATGGRKAETVAAALVALGDGGPAEAAPQTLFQVLEALLILDLEEIASAFSVEAALANGL